MYNKTKKSLIALFTAISILAMNQDIIYAYSTNGYSLNGGVGNYGYTKRYYFVVNCSSPIFSDIEQAWNEWTYTTDRVGITTPISVKRTTTRADSVFDFYFQQQYEQEEGIFAVTFFWKNSNMVSTPKYMPTQNWGWTQIILNNPNFMSLSRNDNGLNRQKGVIAHEIGHAMGLHHVSSPYVLMYMDGSTIRVDKCTADDLNGINSLY